MGLKRLNEAKDDSFFNIFWLNLAHKGANWPIEVVQGHYNVSYLKQLLIVIIFDNKVLGLRPSDLFLNYLPQYDISLPWHLFHVI